MSEVINNKQQRIELMKMLIKRLHKGEQADSVRKQLESVLSEADYADVFRMEVELIQEGIEPEAIRELCDVHTNVLKGHLDNVEPPQTVEGHPLNTMIRENEALSKLCDELDSAISRDNKTEVRSMIHETLSRLNLLMDVEKHYRKKENLLFPFFEKNNLTGPPSVMWAKHDEVREMLKEVMQVLPSIKDIHSAEWKVFYQLTIGTIVTAIRDMIYKEEKILIPTASDLLTEQDFYEIYLHEDEYGYCLIEPPAEWEPAGGVHETISNPAAEAGRIKMPTGNFTLDELIAVFSTMPFDLTFVDKDDTVRYFSPGKDRVFDRSRTIIGRKVQFCHPPSSVHIVNQIVSDFKEGKEDRARFWINMGNRKIYIVYYAVRDQKGEYMGTLEVTQDLTEVQQITGERRLLEYDK